MYMVSGNSEKGLTLQNCSGLLYNAERRAPSAEPSAERRAPSAERRAPSAERRAPSAERRAPSAERRAPSAERRAPSAERRAPSAERRAPSAERRAPSAERRAPSAERRAPSAERRSIVSFRPAGRSRLRTLVETSWLSPCVGGSFAARRGPGSDAPRSASPEYAPCGNRRVPLGINELDNFISITCPPVTCPKDTDGNYLAVCLPRGATENGPRLGAGGNFISIMRFGREG